MAPTRKYRLAKRIIGGEILVVALPRAESIREAARDAGSDSRPSLRRAPADSKSYRNGNPFDVHPPKFRNYRLLWEVYKSERE